MCIQLKPLFSRHKGIGVQFTDEPTGNLDSQSAQQVLEILQSLSNDAGKTVIMVTHDPKAAAFGKRIIQLEKGRFEKEEPLVS